MKASLPSGSAATPAAANHSVESFRHLAETLPQIIWTATPEGVVDYLSPQYSRFTGIPVDHPDYLNWAALIHPDDFDATIALWTHTVETGEDFEHAFRIKASDGNYYWFNERATAARSKDGKIIKWYGSAVDIEHQKNAAFTQRAIAEDKDNFITLLSHELRNPLATISSANEILHNDKASHGQIESALDLLDQQTDYLVRLVDGTFDISRLTLDKLQLAKEKVEISQLITRCTNILTPEAKSHGLTLITRTLPTQIWVNGDQARLSECLTHLLKNAFKYTQSGGNIEVTITTDSGNVSVLVQDTGIGIPPQDLKLLFKPFQKGSLIHETVSSGLGLGLAMVQKLAHLHGGTVTAQSDGIHTGSLFTITLPITAAPAESSHTTGQLNCDIERARQILIITEDVELSESIQLFFELEGHHPYLTVDGETAFEALDQIIPDIILCDLTLTGTLQGLDIAAKVRRDYQQIQKPYLVALTNLVRPDQLEKSLDAGFDKHLVKPILPDQLRNCLALAQAYEARQIATLKKLYSGSSNSRTSPAHPQAQSSKPQHTSASAHRATNKALPEEDHFKHLAEAIPQIVWTANAEGIIDYISSQYSRITSVSPDDPNYFYAVRIHPDDSRARIAAWEYSVKTGEIHESEYRIRTSDGEYRWFSSNAIPIKNPNGEIVKWYGSTTDIETLKQAEFAQQAIAEDKDKFIAMLSHELRNPLSAISTCCEILRNTKLTENQRSSTLDLLDRQTQQLRRLVKDTLDISRLSSDKIEILKKKLELNQLVTQCTTAIAPQIEKCDLTLQLHISSTEIWVDGDDVRLSQCLTNLLNNALKFTETGGTIKVSVITDESSKKASIIVQDTGIGIPPHDIKRLFQPYQQGRHTQQSGKIGLGLGLAVIQQLITLHKGSVTAHSDGIGSGSIFTITLPTLSHGQAEAPPLPQLSRGHQNEKSLSILIIEDNQSVAKALEMFLILEGHQVHLASNGESAFKLMEDIQPNIVFSDLSLPGHLQGWDIAEKISNTPLKRRPYLIALSGHTQPHHLEKCLKAGFNQHIAKPATPDQLRKGILHAMNDPVAS